MNSYNQKFKTSLCRHWQATSTCTLGARCQFAHGPQQLRSPTDPIALAQGILAPMGDVAAVSAMVAAQQYEQALQQHEQLKKQLLAKKHAPQQVPNDPESAAGGVPSQSSIQIANDPALQKRVTLAQLKLIVKEMLKLSFVHNIIMCKIRICSELLEADNLESCTVMLNDIMERPLMHEHQRAEYNRIIEMAEQLAIQMLAEQKVRLQRIQKEHETLLKRQAAVANPPIQNAPKAGFTNNPTPARYMP